jgi:threonine/homoserine efflux transporter RhtA
MDREVEAVLPGVALLPATATVIGAIVLRQIPTVLDLAGIVLVMVGVGLHRESQREPVIIPALSPRGG